MKQAALPIAANRQRGFTMIEMVIVMTMVAVLAAIAVPNMRKYVLNGRITSTTQELYRSIQTARSEALKRQNNVVMCASANPTAGDSAVCATSGITGWIVFEDADNNWDHATDGTEELLEAHTYDTSKLSIVADSTAEISYAATGFINSSGGTNTKAIVICDSRGNVDSNGGNTETNSVARGIYIAPTGRARITSVRDSTSDSYDIADLLGSGYINSSCPP